LSASSSAGLLAQIAKLGTNLLTVTNGQNLFGGTAELPKTAPAMIARIPAVTAVQATGTVDATVYRSPLIPAINTGALALPPANTPAPSAAPAPPRPLPPPAAPTPPPGHSPTPPTARDPVAVLGAAAAQRLGIGRIWPGERIWLGSQWFYLAGILRPAVLAPSLDTAALVGFPAAEHYLHFDGHPSTIYLRAESSHVTAVQALLAPAANPETPAQVNVSQPSAALEAQAAAKSALNGLFLGLGAVALLVGAVGVANIMVISVLERRSEIGLR